MKNQQKYIGVDLGGTNITAGIVTHCGEILHKLTISTKAYRKSDEIIADIIMLINKLLDKNGMDISDIKSIGADSPGAIDVNKGEVIFAGNLNWIHIPLKDELQKAFSISCFVGNDANVAALAEALFGAGKGKKSILLMTLGTGIGGGYIKDGRIQAGFHGVGAEIGHFILFPEGRECTCGNKGCFEAYASATGIINMGKDAIKENPDCMIAKRAFNNPSNITAKIIIDSAKENDKIALKIFGDYTRYIAYGIINIINLINPEVIIIGGGISRAGDFLLDSIKTQVTPRIFCKQAPYSDIILSKMGNEAGIIGAAMLS